MADQRRTLRDISEYGARTAPKDAAEYGAPVKPRKDDGPLTTPDGRYTVYDGDTARDNKTGEHYRLSSIDTPETEKQGWHGNDVAGQAGSAEAKQRLYKILSDQGDYLVPKVLGKDPHGRTVVDLVDPVLGDSASKQMARSGLARPVDYRNARGESLQGEALRGGIERATTGAGAPFSAEGYQPGDAPELHTPHMRGNVVKRAVARGVDQAQLLGNAAVQATGQGVRSLGLTTLGGWLNDIGEKGIEANIRDIQNNPRQSETFSDAAERGLGALGTHVVELLGEQVPMLAGFSVAGLTGQAVAKGLLVRSIENKVAKDLAAEKGTEYLTTNLGKAELRNRTQGLAERVGRQAAMAERAGRLPSQIAAEKGAEYVASAEGKSAVTAKVAEQVTPKALASAGRAGRLAGTGAAGYVTGVGDIQSELRDGGVEAPSTAFLGAIPYAALDALGFEAMIGKWFGPRATSKAAEGAIQNAVTGFVKHGALAAPTEASTEALQEVIAMAGRAYNDPGYELFSPENVARIKEAGLAGGVVGGIAGGVPGAVHGALTATGKREPQPAERPPIVAGRDPLGLPATEVQPAAPEVQPAAPEVQPAAPAPTKLTPDWRTDQPASSPDVPATVVPAPPGAGYDGTPPVAQPQPQPATEGGDSHGVQEAEGQGRQAERLLTDQPATLQSEVDRLTTEIQDLRDRATADGRKLTLRDRQGMKRLQAELAKAQERLAASDRDAAMHAAGADYGRSNAETIANNSVTAPTTESDEIGADVAPDLTGLERQDAAPEVKAAGSAPEPKVNNVKVDGDHMTLAVKSHDKKGTYSAAYRVAALLAPPGAEVAHNHGRVTWSKDGAPVVSVQDHATYNELGHRDDSTAGDASVTVDARGMDHLDIASLPSALDAAQAVFTEGHRKDAKDRPNEFLTMKTRARSNGTQSPDPVTVKVSAHSLVKLARAVGGHNTDFDNEATPTSVMKDLSAGISMMLNAGWELTPESAKALESGDAVLYKLPGGNNITGKSAARFRRDVGRKYSEFNRGDRVQRRLAVTGEEPTEEQAQMVAAGAAAKLWLTSNKQPLSDGKTDRADTADSAPAWATKKGSPARGVGTTGPSAPVGKGEAAAQRFARGVLADLSRSGADNADIAAAKRADLGHISGRARGVASPVMGDFADVRRSVTNELPDNQPSTPSLGPAAPAPAAVRGARVQVHKNVPAEDKALLEGLLADLGVTVDVALATPADAEAKAVELEAAAARLAELYPPSTVPALEARLAALAEQVKQAKAAAQAVDGDAAKRKWGEAYKLEEVHDTAARRLQQVKEALALVPTQQRMAADIRNALATGKPAVIYNDHAPYASDTGFGSYRAPLIIMPDSVKGRAPRLIAYAHELGHVVQRAYLDTADVATQRMLIKAAADAFNASPEELPPEVFAEWFANEVAKYVGSRARDLGERGHRTAAGDYVAGKGPTGTAGFFKRMAAGLKALYKNLRKLLGSGRPDVTVTAFMDGIGLVNQGRIAGAIKPSARFADALANAPAGNYLPYRADEAAPFHNYTIESVVGAMAEAAKNADKRITNAKVRRATDGAKKFAGNAGEFLAPIWHYGLRSLDAQVRAMGNERINRVLMDPFHLRPGSTRGGRDYYKSVQYNLAPFRAKMDDVLAKTGGNKRTVLHKIAGDQHGDWVPPADYDKVRTELVTQAPSANPTTVAVRDYFREVGTWAKSQLDGLTSFNLRKDYAPVMVDMTQIDQRRPEFLAALIKLGYKGEDAGKLVLDLYRNNGMVFMRDEVADMIGPSSSFMRKRQWGPKELAALQSFLVSDVPTLMHEYTNAVVKYVTTARAFGEHVEDPASPQGGKFDPIGKLNNVVLQEENAGRLTPEDADRLRETIVPALLGRLGTDKMPPKLRRLQDWLIVWQNVSKLGLAVLSSFSDVGVVGLRTDSVGGAAKAWKSMVTGLLSGRSREELVGMAKLLGAANDGMVENIVNDVDGSAYFGAKAQEVNNWWFKAIRMHQWTNLMRGVAVNASRDYVEEAYSKRADPKWRKRLEELGLHAHQDELVGQWVAAGKPVRGRGFEVLDNAMLRFVDEAVLRPTPAVRPVWGSDVRFQLFFHLKSFMWAYHEMVLRRVWNQMKGAEGARILVPMAAMLTATMVPAMLGYELRRWLRYAGSDQEPAELSGGMEAWEVAQRAGVLGVMQLGVDLDQAEQHGTFAPLALAGPTVSNLAMFGEQPYDKALAKSLPVAAQSTAVTGWITSMLPGGAN